jgi:N-acetyl-beta-hexosaminidase
VLNVEQSTVDFFRAVFDHVVDVFPSTVVGVGGDEVPLTQWESSERAHRRLADVYGYQPIPAGLTGPAADRVLGAQAQVWTEHLDSARRVDYAAFPRLVAFAEVVWTPAELRDQADFQRRLAAEHLARLDALGVEYRPLSGPHPWQLRPGVPGRPR